MPTVSFDVAVIHWYHPHCTDGTCSVSAVSTQKRDTRKGGKSKKTQLKFSINCSTPVEDEIMDAGSFVS